MITIDISDGKTSFRLAFSGKFNFITGLSGTRKTLILKFLQKYSHGIKSIHAKIMLDGAQLTKQDIFLFSNELSTDEIILQTLTQRTGKLYVIDESSPLLHMRNAGEIMKKSENFFVIITRELLGYLPISIDSIYYIERRGKNLVNIPVYCHDNEALTVIQNKVDYILTEDGRSSRLFFKYFFENENLQVCSEYALRNGKKLSRDNSQLVNFLEEELENGHSHILVVFDAAAFGMYYDILLKLLKEKKIKTVSILAWNSYENYLLKCEPFRMTLTKDDAGCNYNSLEQFSTKVLKDMITYQKSSLPGCIKGIPCNLCGLSKCSYKGKKRDFVQGPLFQLKQMQNNNPQNT